MPSMDKVIMEATIDNIPVITELVDVFMEENDVPMKTSMQIDIAIDEILSNICKFAYDGVEGEMQVEARINSDENYLEVVFVDKGTPYNPLLNEDPDVTASLEERKIGGLGIFMVKKSMDYIDYGYEEGQNVLTIRKIL